jgi:hypothetical protein
MIFLRKFLEKNLKKECSIGGGLASKYHRAGLLVPLRTDPEVVSGPELDVYRLHTLSICHEKEDAAAFDVDEVSTQELA